MRLENYEKIPYELQRLNQWVLWKYVKRDGKETKPLFQTNGHFAKVNDPSTWTDFQTAIRNVQNFDGIGFVLTENDPYVVIDLDYTENIEEGKQQREIFDNLLETYAELSPSGKGLHIVGKGRLNKATKKPHVEMYDRERYITFTGNIYNNAPISDIQIKVDYLHKLLNQSVVKETIVPTVDEIYDDNTILNVASTAENGQKFIDLYEGRWQEYYGDSQSEADFALINIISFYSRNFEQIKRIFRASALGKRKKALREDYVNAMVTRSFDNYIPSINIGGMVENLEKIKNEVKNETKKGIRILTPFEYENGKIEEVQIPVPNLTEQKITYPDEALNVEFEDLPNGPIKEVARFIYAQSPRPNKTISMVAAISLFSGICGRAYNVIGTGVNNYFVLLANTGIGKEAMNKGISRLFNEISELQPQGKTFIGLGEMVSGSALLRYLSEETQCCLTIQGEFGMTMQRMSGRNATPVMLQLRKILLDLYNKSGKQDFFRSTVYSDKTKNIAEIKSPAFTMLCESTPSTFFDALSDSLVDEGLISRFTIFETTSGRAKLNKNHNKITLNEDLKNYFLNLVTNNLTLNSLNQCIDVQFTKEAEDELDRIDEDCNEKMNVSENDSYREVWNRAHIKIAKLAGVFAIAENIYEPRINISHINYAKRIIYKSCGFIYDKYAQKEIGYNSVSDDKKREDVLYTIGRLIYMQKFEKESEKIQKMLKSYIIPYSFLYKNLSARRAFKSEIKNGTQLSILSTIDTLKNEGILEELGKMRLKTEFDYSGKAWVISDPRTIIDFYNANVKSNRFN